MLEAHATWKHIRLHAFIILQVYSMRETHDELCRLLGQQEAQSLGAAEVFTPLAHLPVLQVSTCLPD